MTNKEKLDEMNRQLLTTKSPYKKRDLLKGIHRLEIKMKNDKTNMKLVGDNLYLQKGE